MSLLLLTPGQIRMYLSEPKVCIDRMGHDLEVHDNPVYAVMRLRDADFDTRVRLLQMMMAIGLAQPANPALLMPWLRLMASFVATALEFLYQARAQGLAQYSVDVPS